MSKTEFIIFYIKLALSWGFHISVVDTTIYPGTETRRPGAILNLYFFLTPHIHQSPNLATLILPKIFHICPLYSILLLLPQLTSSLGFTWPTTSNGYPFLGAPPILHTAAVRNESKDPACHCPAWEMNVSLSEMPGFFNYIFLSVQLRDLSHFQQKSVSLQHDFHWWKGSPQPHWEQVSGPDYSNNTWPASPQIWHFSNTKVPGLPLPAPGCIAFEPLLMLFPLPGTPSHHHPVPWFNQILEDLLSSASSPSLPSAGLSAILGTPIISRAYLHPTFPPVLVYCVFKFL